MSRWHRESCSNPVIVIERRVPNCKSCNASPDLDAIILAQSAKRLSPSAIPPDEPLGQFNLWWPPCVPYLSETPAAGVIGEGFTSSSVPKADPLASGMNNSQYTSCDYIYPSQIQHNQFRLLRLTSVDDIDAPVHVDLEIHDDERHPDYETVSYTWGGEAGDSTICQPVYVGKHWDLLPQTQNCWEMLRYLRPRRDIRTVWVDAICINQGDFTEREIQVAKMGLIFENAIRTVVYLGPDLVFPTSTSSPYPRRYYLQELNTLLKNPGITRTPLQRPEQLTFATLLRREYFQRIWVIQELVLSRNVTFEIGDVAFIIDRQPIGFNKSPAAWTQLIRHGTLYNGRRNPILSAVDLVSESKSTDPRDKIFGILGMIRNIPQLTPSYSISSRHLSIGYFAYCLTGKKDMRIIIHAAGLQAAANMPSWTPPVYRTGRIPRLGDDKGLSMIDSRPFFWEYSRHHSEAYYHSKEYCRDLSAEIWKEVPVTKSTTDLHELKVYASFNQWNPDDHSQTCWKIRGDQISQHPSNLPNGFPNLTGENNRASPSRHWHSHVKVDTLTGALLDVTAIQIFCFGQLGLSLAETYHEDMRDIYTYVFTNRMSSLLVYSKGPCFALPTDLSETYLFALKGDSTDIIESRLCVLRSVHEDTFRLVSANVDICFHTPNFRTKSVPSELDQWDGIHIRDLSPEHMWLAQDNASPTALPMIRHEAVNHILGTNHWNDWDGEPEKRCRHRILSLDKLYGDLSSITQQLRRTWVFQRDYSQDYLRFLTFNCSLSPPLWISFAFPGVTDPVVYLRILYAAFLVENNAEGSVKSFLELYLQVVDELSPRLLSVPQETSIDNELRDDPGIRTAASEVTSTMIDSETLVELFFKPHQFSTLTEVLDLARGHRPEMTRRQYINETIRPKLLIVHSGEAPIPQEFLAAALKLAPFRGSHDGTHPQFLLGDDFRSVFAIEHFSDGIHKHQGETIRIVFDLRMIMTWAQLHPCTAAFRALTPYCREGENELTLLLRDPLPEDAEVVVPWWPQVIVDSFGLNKSVSLRKIAIV